MFPKYKNILILFTTSILLSLMLPFIESDKFELKVSDNKFQSNHQEYTIGPDISRYHINYVNTNVVLKTALNDSKYGLISFLNDIKATVLPAQNLSISFERIAELGTWSKKLSIINNAHNSKELKSWWISYQTTPLTVFNNDKFRSWESILARYLISTEKYINHIKSQDNKMQSALAIILRLSLNENQLQINKDIYNLQRDYKDKEYLQIISDSIFKDLNSQVDQLISSYSPITHHYDLSELRKSKEYGIYNVYISKPDNIKFDWGNALLQGKNSKFKTLSKDSQPYNGLLFDGVEITPNLDKLTLNFTDIKNSARDTWLAEIDQANQQYKYVLYLKDINPKIGYMLNLIYQTIYPLDFVIEELQGSLADNNQVVWNKSNMIWKDVILSPSNPSHYLRKVSFTFNDELIRQRIVIESEKPLPEDFFDHFKLQIFPVFESYVTLKQIAKLENLKAEIKIKEIKKNIYLANLKNLTLNEEKKVKSSLGLTYWITKKTNYQNATSLTIVFWPPIAIKSILFILIIIIVIKLVYEIYLKQILENNKELYLPLTNKLKNYLNVIARIISALTNSVYFRIKEIRLILFIMILTGILIDIGLIKFGLTKRDSLLTVYIVGVLWLITLVGYRGKTALSFYMSLVLFILFSILLMINLPIIGERLLTWSYVFLLFGSIHALGEVCVKRNLINENNNPNISVTPKLLSLLSIMQKCLKYSLHLLINLLIIALKYLKYYLYLLDKLLTFMLKSLDAFIHLITAKLLHSHLYILYKRMKVIIHKSVINIPWFSNPIFFQNIQIHLRKSFQYSIKSTTWLLTATVIIYLVVLLINAGFKSLNLRKVKESRNPVVQKFEPRIVYYATKVIIKGKNFGWKNEGEELISNFGKVYTDFWSNEKIIFTIPLHWKTGEVSLRLEKPNIWQGKPIISKSKIITLWLLPITASFTNADTEFYEQMSLTDKETQKINGYEWH
ncbi:MAG: hypothetical protein HYW86_04540 [Candidatus Roizmanbacteria bacterium]|nr:MAG: hypothetical protein HYW86_04540 [Candidatus Roizmanbacteria bacterium]